MNDSNQSDTSVKHTIFLSFCVGFQQIQQNQYFLMFIFFFDELQVNYIHKFDTIHGKLPWTFDLNIHNDRVLWKAFIKEIHNEIPCTSFFIMIYSTQRNWKKFKTIHSNVKSLNSLKLKIEDYPLPNIIKILSRH